MAIPTLDNPLSAWGSNFDAKVTASPVTYDLTAPQALDFHTKLVAFQAALAVVQAAHEGGSQTTMMTATKNTAKKDLLLVGRDLYAIVQNSDDVSDANKLDIGVVVRKTNTSPTPPPSTSPSLDLVAVSGRTARVKIHDGTVSGRRGRPAGTIGAILYGAVGETAPSDINGWINMGIVGTSIADVTFPDTVAAGAVVWITAQWFNFRKQTGPAADPISANLPGGLSTLAA